MVVKLEYVFGYYFYFYKPIVKTSVRFFQIFVASSQYLNFTLGIFFA